MTREELLAQIDALEDALEGLPEIEQAVRRPEISTLRIRLHGMALDEVADVMARMTLPDIADMKAKIAAAKVATAAHQDRVAAIDRVLGLLTRVVI